VKKYWEQLKPLERRWAVAIGGMLFLLANYFFIWPRFHDWARDNARIAADEDKIATYNKELAKKSVYEAKLKIMQAGGAGDVKVEDQAIDMVHFYNSRMLSNQVLLLNSGTLTTRTNQFTTDQQLGINVEAYETNLVNFLYSLGAGNSMVRVRAMSLHPNGAHQQLNANITMVASYQKKAAARTGAATTTARYTPATPPAKPATSVPAPAPTTTPAPPPMGQPGGKPPVTQTNKGLAGFARPTVTNRPGQLPPNAKRP
jgi:hypothetical protein